MTLTFPVLVELLEGQYAATLVGAPHVRVVGSTRDEAIAALRAEIAERVQRGELLTLEIDALGVADLAGKYAEDPTLRPICADAYHQRDREPRE